MAMFEEIGGLLTRGETLRQFSSFLGEDENATKSALGASVPLLLGGLDKRAKRGGGAKALFGLVEGDDGGVLDNVGGLVGAGDNSGMGSTLVGAMLGSRRNVVEESLASSTGLGLGTITKFLPMIAPLVLGFLGKKQSTESFGQSGLSKVLGDERSSMEKSGLGGLLGLLDGGDDDADDLGFSNGLSRIAGLGGFGAMLGGGAGGAGSYSASSASSSTSSSVSSGSAGVSGSVEGADVDADGGGLLGGSVGKIAAGGAGVAGMAAAASGAFKGGTPDVPDVDLPKVETPKVDMPKVETPKVDMPKVETPKVDMPKVETPKVDLPDAGDAKIGKGTIAAGGAAAVAGAAAIGKAVSGKVPDVDLPKVDTPKVDLPKVTKPKVEAPKVTKPKVEAPKVTKPKVEAPKVTKPKVEAPKVTKPKVDKREIKTTKAEIERPVRAAKTTTTTTTKAAAGGSGAGYEVGGAATGGGSWGWLKWLLPLLLLAALAIFLLSRCGSDDESVSSDEVAAVVDPTATAEPEPEPTEAPDPTATAEPEPEPEPTEAPEPTATAEPEPEPTAAPAAPAATCAAIVDVATDAGVFNTLLTAVQASPGTLDALTTSGPLTIFAPTDEAFAALPADVTGAALADPELLSSILNYHVVAGAVGSGDLSNGAVATLNGANVYANVNGAAPRINNATVVAPDNEADECIIHGIDRVLIPASALGAVGGTLNDAVGQGTVRFTGGAATLTDDSKVTLDAICAYQMGQDVPVNIGGIKVSSNDELSQQRSDAVREYLIDCGLDADTVAALIVAVTDDAGVNLVVEFTG